MIHPERLLVHRKQTPGAQGRYVLYWMQQSQRTVDNHALLYAITQANGAALPLLVVFALTGSYPEANGRHYQFMAQGLMDVARDLRNRGISFLVLSGDPASVLQPLLADTHSLVMDSGVLRHQRDWRQAVLGQGTREMKGEITEVDSDLVVPVRVASDKAEYSARTLRPKIHRRMDEFLDPVLLPALVRQDPDLGLQLAGEKAMPACSTDSPEALLSTLNLDWSVGAVPRVRGGQTEARKQLDTFLEQGLSRYGERNNPGSGYASGLSPYLHFGQISPVTVIHALREKARSNDGDPIPRAAEDAFQEELVVRRELAHNFVFYNPGYDRFSEMTDAWAYRTMEEHRTDPRPVLYTLEELEGAATADPYWNGAMEEMVLSGRMDSYMRMYWGKKILEWSPDVQEAYRRTLYLNNRYFLDGRDANSFAAVAWCYGKHDRAWQERPVFGKLRYMNARGLERKFDMQEYLDGVKQWGAGQK